MTVGIGTTELTIELRNSIITTASNAANSSMLTWEDTNKSSWTDYVEANSSNGELNSTSTYQNEYAWTKAHQNIFSESYKTAYDTAYNDIVGDS